MSEELKPCPFCGGKSPCVVKDVQYPDSPYERTWFAIECGTCQATGDWDLGESGAIEKWNSRALEDALRTRIAELEARLQAPHYRTDPFAPDDDALGED